MFSCRKHVQWPGHDNEIKHHFYESLEVQHHVELIEHLFVENENHETLCFKWKKNTANEGKFVK